MSNTETRPVPTKSNSSSSAKVINSRATKRKVPVPVHPLAHRLPGAVYVLISMAKYFEGAPHGLFVLLWGQCKPGIQNKLRVVPDLALRKESGDCAWLFNEIRQVMYEYSST